MENFNTDTQLPSRDATRDSVDFWASIEYQKMLRGEREAVTTDEDLHDLLGLGDRGVYHILDHIKRNNKS